MVSAWTIGTSKRSNLYGNHHVPGPGQYNQEKQQRKRPPTWKIGNSKREAFNANKNPGPGNYQLRPQTGGGPGYSIATKSGAPNDALHVPGPGAYNPRPQTAQQRQPAYTMGSKYDSDYYNNKNVGPGSYKHESTLAKNAPKMGTQDRGTFYQKNYNPGPGQYKPTRPSTAQRAKIGTSQRGELYQTSTDAIGPGSYDLKSQFDQSRGVTMTSKRQYGDMTEASLVPGPGSYNPNKQQRKQPPSYKIGTGARGKLNHQDRNTPGPGNYDPFGTGNGPKVKIGTDTRKPLNQVQENPGPGNYEYNSKVVEGPKYSIKGASKVDPITREKIMNPGPGQYQPRTNLSKSRPASAQFGTSTRPNFHKQREVPGAGQYDLQPKKGGPSYGFGTSQRSGFKKNDEPGPGNYNLPNTFADIPSYAKGGRNVRK